MSERADQSFESIVKIAASLSSVQLEQMLLMLTPSTRAMVRQALGNNRPSDNNLPDPDASPRTVAEDRMQDNPLPNGDFNQPTGCGSHQRLPATVILDSDSASTVASDPTGPSLQDGVSLIKLHARGAFGEVFVAHDQSLSREVAVKRLRPDLAHDQRRATRFVREAEITAQLQHPGIVPIYSLNVNDAGSNYTMPLVSGSTLHNLIVDTHEKLGPRPNRDQWQSGIRPLLIHFIAACHAIDYAHSQQVLHRDIKPANIIIGQQGQTLVLDWGCAKKFNEADHEIEPLEIENDELEEIFGEGFSSRMTVAESVMGTLEFMSPEQAGGKGSSVGPASDIFGLGATLFHLITGDFAIQTSGSDTKEIDSALKQVRQCDFRRVEEVAPRVPPAIAAICHRAMATNPAQRYATADDLARDVDAFLAGTPVSAYQESWTDRTGRFVKRHRTLFTTLLGVLLVGFASAVLLALMANLQRAALTDKNNELANLNIQLEKSVTIEQQLAAEAIVREQKSVQQLYQTQMLLASEASSEPGGVGRMRQLTNRWRDDQFKAFRGWEWQHLDALGHRELWSIKSGATANKIMFTRDAAHGRILDTGAGLMLEIDTDGERLLDPATLPDNVTTADFNRDQSQMALGFRDGSVKVYDMTGKKLKPVEFLHLTSAVTDVCWNIGGDMLATCDSSGQMVVWQWYEQAIVAKASGVLNQPNKRLLNWSYDGKQVCWTTGRDLRALNIENQTEVVLAQDHWIVSPCWSHEGKLIAYIGPENVIAVVDPAAKKTTRFKGHQLFIESLSWHPHRHYLLSSSADGTVRIWNADTEKQTHLLLGHNAHVYSAAWTSAGDKVVSGGLPEDALHVWDLTTLGSAAFERELQDHPAVAWHPDGQQLAVAEGVDIVIQDERGRTRWMRDLGANNTSIYGIDVDAQGKKIACVSRKGRVWTVSFETGKLEKLYDPGSDQNLYPDLTSKSVAWSPEGLFLAAVGSNGEVRVWNTQTGINIAETLPICGKSLVVSWQPSVNSDQSWLAVAGTQDNITIFDARKKTVIAELRQPGWKTGLDWSPEGDALAISDRRSVAIWQINNSEKPELTGVCEGPSAMVLDLSWSNQSDRIAALTEDGKVCLWNARTRAYIAKFDLHQRVPYSIHWSPDGRRLVSTARHGRIEFQGIDQ